MKTKYLAFALVAGLLVTGAGFAGDKTVKVGGQLMYPTKDIVDNAVNSADHTTLVAAVKAAGLVETLKGPGPFTVFAPTNDAFENLPAGTVESVLKPENKQMLVAILTYHVVPGRLDAKWLWQMLKKGNGKAQLKTVQGDSLWFLANGDNIILQDAKGGQANLTVSNVMQSNGVIHVIDGVLMP